MLAWLTSCLTSCAQKHDAPAPVPSASPAPPKPVDPKAEAAAHRREIVQAARARFAAGAWDGPYIGAMNMQTSVMSETAWPASLVDGGSPSSLRLGYLRHGARVPVIPEPIVDGECTDGWYELVQGGFVCGKYATLDLKNPRVRLAPRPPDMNAPLPYKYAYNLTHGTPLYRRVLSLEDRTKYEPWLAPKPPPPAPVTAVQATTTEGNGESDPVADPLDAGAPPARDPAAGPSLLRVEPVDAAAVPWYLRDYDGGKPQITLDDLHGRGVLVRRMVRGFYLALDRDFKAAHAHWWRTTAGFAVPFERVALAPTMPDFHGAWLAPREGEGAAPGGAGAAPSTESDGGPLAEEADAGEGDAGAPRPTVLFITTTFAQKYRIDLEKKKVTPLEPLPRRSAVALVGPTFVSSGVTFAQTALGFWVRTLDGTPAIVASPPPEAAPDATWVDVNLTKQTLVAFEGSRPVFATYVSTGKRNLVDKDKDHPTPAGVFRIREKHVTATMDGDVAADGPYSIEDVPWVMYFQGSYALHGAFWHANFGHMMSHGCVNMSPADARTLFQWTEPRLPQGWHGVFASDAQPGTWVVIHE